MLLDRTLPDYDVSEHEPTTLHRGSCSAPTGCSSGRSPVSFAGAPWRSSSVRLKVAEKPVLTALVEYRAQEHPERVFVKMRDVSITWAEFWDRVQRFAR